MDINFNVLSVKTKDDEKSPYLVVEKKCCYKLCSGIEKDQLS